MAILSHRHAQPDSTLGWGAIHRAFVTLFCIGVFIHVGLSPLLALTELLVAALLMFARRLGYLGVIAFHLALMTFGWGWWLWSLPALAFAVPAAVHEFRTHGDRG